MKQLLLISFVCVAPALLFTQPNSIDCHKIRDGGASPVCLWLN